MRKIKLSVIAVFLIGIIRIFGTETQTYYNYERGWRGEVTISPENSMTSNEWDKFASNFVDNMKKNGKKNYETSGLTIIGDFKSITKLSKKLSWLCWQALDEYEIAYGEVYYIVIDSERTKTHIIVRIVKAEGSGKSFEWYGMQASYH